MTTASSFLRTMPDRQTMLSTLIPRQVNAVSEYSEVSLLIANVLFRGSAPDTPVFAEERGASTFRPLIQRNRHEGLAPDHDMYIYQ